jgi:hypothetical protein
VPREPPPQTVAHVLDIHLPSPPPPFLRGTYFGSTSSVPKWASLHLPCASWLAVYTGLCLQYPPSALNQMRIPRSCSTLVCLNAKRGEQQLSRWTFNSKFVFRGSKDSTTGWKWIKRPTTRQVESLSDSKRNACCSTNHSHSGKRILDSLDPNNKRQVLEAVKEEVKVEKAQARRARPNFQFKQFDRP